MLTAATLKSWARTNRQLAIAVVEAQAFALAERIRVDAYIAPVFATFAFTDSDDGSPITDPRKLYLSDDMDGCAAFYDASDVAHRANGYTGEAGTCPALTAESHAIKAENKLLESLGAYMGVDAFGGSLELRAKALKLALDCAIGGVK